MLSTHVRILAGNGRPEQISKDLPQAIEATGRPRFGDLAVAALPVLGLFLPTSVEGDLNYWLVAGADLTLLCLILILISRPGGHLGPQRIGNSALILTLLAVCTLLSPLTETAYLSTGGPYLLLALVLIVNCRNARAPSRHILRTVLICLDILIIIAGILVYWRFDWISSFLINHYSAFTPGMTEDMVKDQKPVLTFSTHSLAGFFYCLFFYLNWRTWRRGKHALFLVCSCSFILLDIMTKSVSGYVSALVALGVIVWHLIKRPAAMIGLAVLLCILSLAALVGSSRRDEILSDVLNVITSEHNGVLGRYTGNGTVVLNLRYIMENPWHPIGLRYSKDLWIISDSGIVEHLLRGSLPLALLLYTGLWRFLRRNLYRPESGLFLFWLYMGFELGFSNLLYFRTLYLLPFVVFYLNSVDLRQSSIGAKHAIVLGTGERRPLIAKYGPGVSRDLAV